MGFLVYVGDSLVSWTPHKQVMIARSSTGFEYRAIASTMTQLEWVKNLLLELRIQVLSLICLKSNNQDVTFLASNPISHSKLKHVALDFKWVRERVEVELVRLVHIPSKDQRGGHIDSL